VEHHRRAIGATLAILIAPDRRRTDRPDDTGLFLGFNRSRGVAGKTIERIALRNHPAPGAARSDQQNFGGTIHSGAAETVGENGYLTHSKALPFRGSGW